MPHFKPFSGDHSSTRRNLPHWSADDCTYFITFRQEDSIPKAATNSWNARRKDWLRHQGVIDPSDLPPEKRQEYYQRFGKEFHDTLDKGHGSCLLKNSANADILRTILTNFDGERYHLGDFVIMSNHVHLLVVLAEEHALDKTMKSWKGISARKINQRENRKGTLWQAESYDHIVRSRRELERIIRYISANPGKVNLQKGQYLAHTTQWTFGQ